MTVQTTQASVTYQGNAATTAFPFAFMIQNANDLVVYTTTAGVITQLVPTTFSVTGLGSPSGGSLTYPLVGSPIPIGTSITIARATPRLQPTSYANQGNQWPAAVESGLDNLEYQIQELQAAQTTGVTLFGVGGSQPNWYSTDTGTVNNIAFTPTNPPTAYADSQLYFVKVANTNTSSPTTLNINSLGAKNIYDSAGALIAVGMLVAGTIAALFYNSSLNTGAGGFQLVDQFNPTASGSGYTGFRNRIINGAMRVCQRIIPSNGTVSLSTGAWNYGGVDRFMTNCIGPGSYSTGMDVSTVPAGLPGHAGYQSALRIVGAASNNNPGIQQRIEQRNSADLVSQQVVVSCYVYQNTGSTMTASMNLNRATNGPDDFSLEAADNAVTMTTSSVPSGAWTRVSGYVTPSTSATLGMEFRILLTGNLGAGTTVWFDLFQVELNAASTSPTTFEEKPQGFELEQCLRYLFAANGNTTSINSPVGMGQCFSTTQSHIYITFPVPLRIAPTTVTVNSASNFELFDASGTGHTSNGISLSNQATVNGAVLNATLSSALLVAGNATELDFLNITAGQLLFSAEL